MASLYDLTGQYLELFEMLQDEEIDPEVLNDTIEAIDGEIEVKAESYAKIIKSLESDMEGLDKEISRLTSRYNTYKNRIQWLKQNLQTCMTLTGKKKFKTDLFSFNIQKNGGKRKLVLDVDIDEIPTEYRIPQPDKVDNEALRNLLNEKGIPGTDGSVNCPYAHLEPQSESLRIK